MRARCRARSASTISATSVPSLTSGTQSNRSRRLAGVAEQHVNLRRAQEVARDADMVLPMQPGMAERQFAEIADAVRLAGGDHVIVRLILLQHQPHGPHVVARVAPVALGVEVAELERFGEAELDARDAVRHLARDELDAAQRALMVEQDAAARVQAKTLAVIDRHPVRVELSGGIGAARVKGRALALARLLDEAEHLRAARLVKTAPSGRRFAAPPRHSPPPAR